MGAVMRKRTRIIGAAAGLAVGLVLSGCADTDFGSMNPLSWLTSSEAEAAPPATAQAQAAPTQAVPAAVTTPQGKARTAAAKKSKGQPASAQAQAAAPSQAQASAVTPVASAGRVDEPAYIKVQDIGIQENDGPH